jgi:non-ribosomal peptide synthetase component E (peptide arylation enzyme)
VCGTTVGSGDNAGMLYHQTLARAARFFPHRVAVVDGERRVTYGELAVRVEQLAGLLASLGFAAGDRLAFLLPNSLEFVENSHLPAAGSG